MSRSGLGDGAMTVREAGRRGGRRVLEVHGRDHFVEIGRRASPPPPEVRQRTAKLGAAAQAAALGPEGMHAKAVRGGEALLARRGRAYYAEIARRRP